MSDQRLQVEQLSVAYALQSEDLFVVDDFSLEVSAGEIVGIAGESGSGKTTAALATIGYYGGGKWIKVSGRSVLDGVEITKATAVNLRKRWAREISYVAQDAARSLNPGRRIGAQILEVVKRSSGTTGGMAYRRVCELLASVHLEDVEASLKKYPYEFSGGQLQRIAMAMAIAKTPRLLILDEPTTGLDVTTQAEVVTMLVGLIKEARIAALYVSHDLGLLRAIADRLIILYAGQIVEEGPTDEVTRHPRHPYTRALLDSLLSVRRPVRARVLPGLPPGRVLQGTCAFADRCSYRQVKCTKDTPALVELEHSRRVRCIRFRELGVLESPRGQFEHSRSEVIEDQKGKGGPLLTVSDLTCDYRVGGRRRSVRAVDDVSLMLGMGEVVALVGESGSGKSTIARAITGIISPSHGQIHFDGTDLRPLATSRTRQQRKDIQIIFQNPDSSLNPRQTVRRLVERPIELLRPEVRRRDRQNVVEEALRDVQLDPTLASRYPHELSGGQRQRVAIARAFVALPRLVVCDEIVSGQDVSVQAAILELVREMQEKLGTTLLFISHDLAVVRSIAQRVYVIEQGVIREVGTTTQILQNPQHPYTQRLMGAVLRLEVRGAIAAV